MSGHDLFRRRIAPLLFLGLIALIAFDTCHKQQRTHTTIVIELGDARARVTSIDAELVVDGEQIATVHRIAAPGLRIDPPRFEAAMPSEDAELRIDVAIGGELRHLVRRIHAIEGGVVTVPLASDLAR